MTTMVECFHCGNDFDEEEGGWWDDVRQAMACDYCEHEVSDECGICGERFSDTQSGLVVLILPSDEAADPEDEPDDGAALRPGLYLVRRWPIYSQPLVGMGHVHDDSLQRIADVPADARSLHDPDTTICQHVCLGCAEPYVLAHCMPVQLSRHGWMAAGRTFLRREDAERWRAGKVAQRMDLMLERLGMGYERICHSAPCWTRKQRRRRQRWRKGHVRIYGKAAAEKWRTAA